MTASKTVTSKNIVRNPLLMFRKRANCNECPLCEACERDKTLEIRCLLALIADSQHNTLHLNTLRGKQP